MQWENEPVRLFLRNELGPIISGRQILVDGSASAMQSAYESMEDNYVNHSKVNESLLPDRSFMVAQKAAVETDYLSSIVESDHSVNYGLEASARIANIKPDQTLDTDYTNAVIARAEKLKGHMPQPSDADNRQFEARKKLDELYGAV